MARQRRAQRARADSEFERLEALLVTLSIPAFPLTVVINDIQRLAARRANQRNGVVNGIRVNDDAFWLALSGLLCAFELRIRTFELRVRYV